MASTAGTSPCQGPICFSQYNAEQASSRPYVLHCGHSFCGGCLQGLGDVCPVFRTPSNLLSTHPPSVNYFQLHVAMEDQAASVSGTTATGTQPAAPLLRAEQVPLLPPLARVWAEEEEPQDGASWGRATIVMSLLAALVLLPVLLLVGLLVMGPLLTVLLNLVYPITWVWTSALGHLVAFSYASLHLIPDSWASAYDPTNLTAWVDLLLAVALPAAAFVAVAARVDRDDTKVSSFVVWGLACFFLFFFFILVLVPLLAMFQYILSPITWACTMALDHLMHFLSDRMYMLPGSWASSFDLSGRPLLDAWADGVLALAGALATAVTCVVNFHSVYEMYDIMSDTIYDNLISHYIGVFRTA